ncbi:MAG: hypothetical protein FJY88_09855 [Candidatus Eisenbacteria bacterium]|nr:hypothetical protein [Candidatus Eisenbacteria bacterium]
MSLLGPNTLIDSVLVNGVKADYVADFIESGELPAPEVEMASQIIRGTAVTAMIYPAVPYRHLRVGLSTKPGGYFRASVPDSDATGSINAVVVLSNSGGYGQLPMVFVGETDSGNTQAKLMRLTVNTQAQGSHLLQVSLNWSSPVDMDLHVTTPSGEDIYYGRKEGSFGGVLDLDSNAGCAIDNINNENITWAEVLPLLGEYQVRVDLWSACEFTRSIPYVVTVRTCTQDKQFFGSFDPAEADYGGDGAGVYVTSIEFGDPSENFILTMARAADPSCTSGYLIANGDTLCYAVERPWEDESQNLSSIPAGAYCTTLRYDEADHWTLSLSDVPRRRAEVVVHLGNETDPAKGCLLVGTRPGDDSCTIQDSTAAYGSLKNAFYGRADSLPQTDRAIIFEIRDAETDSRPLATAAPSAPDPSAGYKLARSKR